MTSRDLEARDFAEESQYDLSIPGYIRVLKRFWVFVKPYQSKYILSFLLLFVSVPFAQFAIFLTRDVTNQALLATDKTVADRWETVLNIVLIQAAFWFLSSLFSTMREVLEWYNSMRSTYDLRRTFYRHLHTLPLTFLRQRPTGEHLYRSTVDFGKPDADGYDPGVMGMITRQFSLLAEQALNVVWGGVFLYLINPVLGWLLAAYMVPYLIVGWFAYDQVRRSFFQQRTREEFETAVLRDSIGGLRTVKSMGRIKLQRRRYLNSAILARRKGMQLLWWQTTADHLALWSVRWIFNGLIGGYTTYMVLSGKATIGDWFASVALLTGVQLPLEKLFTLVQTIRRDMVPAQRILETLDVKPDLADKPDAIELGPLTGRIEFKNVTFAYEEGKPALSDLSFVIEYGEKVGFVGPSGAGKSSVLSLLLRLFAPQQGEILVDGVNTLDAKLQTILDQVAVVPQSTYLYDDTIANNILFGNKKASPTELKEASDISGVSAFAAKQNEGLERQVGEGATISGGERQRIGIARALIRNPKVLILDEATANLDPRTEGEILKTIRKISAGRTTLAVAHRLKAVMHCDRIFVMQLGRIVEVGNHEELIKSGGLYSSLWREQADTVDEALAANPKVKK